MATITDIVYKFANEIWNLWLGLMFLGVVVYACWPTKKAKKRMEEASKIPLREK